VQRSLAVTENEVVSLHDRLHQGEAALAATSGEADGGLSRRMRLCLGGFRR